MLFTVIMVVLVLAVLANFVFGGGSSSSSHGLSGDSDPLEEAGEELLEEAGEELMGFDDEDDLI